MCDDTSNKEINELAAEISREIKSYKKNGGENNGGFSVDATYDEGDGYSVTLEFDTNTDLVIMVSASSTEKDAEERKSISSLYCKPTVAKCFNFAHVLLMSGSVEGRPGYYKTQQ